MVSAKKSMKKRILVIITVLLVFSAVSLVATKLIYDGIFTRYDTTAQIPAALSDMVAQREEHSFLSGENTLAGYHYRSHAADARPVLIVLAPGFHAGADDYLWQIKSLLDRGWSVFAYDATGSCRSGGESAMGFPQSILDMEAALKYVEKCRNFDYNDIVLLGHSQGGYAAGCMLSMEYDVAAVVTVSGVNSAMEGIMGYATAYVGPLAYGNYGFLWLYQALLFGPERTGLDAAEAISESEVPVLVVHGTGDTRVPADRYSIISHKEKIDPEGVTYLLWEETGSSGHTDLLFDPDGTANEELMDEIHSFLLESIKK